LLDAGAESNAGFVPVLFLLERPLRGVTHSGLGRARRISGPAYLRPWAQSLIQRAKYRLWNDNGSTDHYMVLLTFLASNSPYHNETNINCFDNTLQFMNVFSRPAAFG
jgi:hypothetical protein